MEKCILMYLMTNELIGSLGIASRMTMEALKKTPFNDQLLARRDAIKADLKILTDINVAEGMNALKNIEQCYGVNFRFLIEEKAKMVISSHDDVRLGGELPQN